MRGPRSVICLGNQGILPPKGLEVGESVIGRGGDRTGQGG